MQLQLGHALVTALVLAVGQHVAHPQSGEGGDVFEPQAFDAAVGPFDQIESVEHEQLAIVGQLGFMLRVC